MDLFYERLQGIDSYVPGAAGDDKQVALLIPKKKGKKYGHCLSLIARLDLTVNMTSGENDIPLMDLYRAIGSLELAPAAVGTLIAPSTRGIDMAAWHCFARNGMNRDDLLNGAAKLEAPASGTVDRIVSLYFRVPFRHRGYIRPTDFVIPGYLFSTEDALKFHFAASTVFAALSTSSALTKIAVKMWAEMAYTRDLQLPAILRVSDNTENRSTLTVGPFVGADLESLVLCSDLHGLGSSDGLDGINAVEWEPRCPPVVPQLLMFQFTRELDLRLLDTWPVLDDGQTFDGSGYQSLQYAAVLPLRYPTPRGKAKLSDRRPNTTGDQILLTFAGATPSTRYLITTLDRWDEERGKMWAARAGLAGNFRIKTQRPTNGGGTAIDPENAIYLPRVVVE